MKQLTETRHALASAANIAKGGALYSGMILFSDAVGLGVDSILLGRNMFHYFTLFTLAQAALLFLAAGALDVTASLSFSKVRGRVTKTEKAWSVEGQRKAQSRAAPFIVTGIILFVLSFALAYPLN